MEAGKSKSNFHNFMDCIIKNYFKYIPGSADPVQLKAVEACYRRFGKAGKDIMAFALDDPMVALRGVKAIGDRMEKANLCWNLDTAARWFPDWMVDPEGYEHETDDKERF